MVPLLLAEGLVRDFAIGANPWGSHGSGKILRAVDHVTLHVDPGETLGLVGESGCGKTTVGRLILRLMPATAGRIVFEGQDITHLPERRLRDFRRAVQVVFQDPYSSLNPRLTVRDIVGEPLRNFGATRRAAAARVGELLDTVGLPPDYMTRVQQGGFYGWPYSYIGQNPQPGFAQLRPDMVKAAITPDVLFQPHSSAMDILFYTGSQFPAEYRGDAFVALKGSWNRSEPTGYKVVRVPFKDGKPQGSYQNFVTGFWSSGLHRAEVWGRPAALAVTKDGALLIADDTGGTIWRIAYTGAKPRGSGPPQPTTGAPAN